MFQDKTVTNHPPKKKITKIRNFLSLEMIYSSPSVHVINFSDFFIKKQQQQKKDI